MSDNSVGRVLQLLHGAHQRASSVEATFRTWRNTLALDEAFRQWAETQPPGSVGLTVPKGPGRLRRLPNIVDETHHLWKQGSAHFRYEIDLPDRQGTRTKVVNGEYWWVYTPEDGLETNEGASTPIEVSPTGIEDSDVLLMLDPSPFIPGIDIEVHGMVTVSGREAIEVTALPRGAVAPVLWPGTRTYEITVDAEAGAILKAAGFMEDTPLAVIQAESIAFNSEIPDDVFSFIPPPGTTRR